MIARRISTSRKQQDEGSWARYCLFHDILSDSHEVTLLIDGAQAFPSMIEAIEGSKRTILMDSYIFNDDSAGRMFAAALGERAKAGVAVYLIVDGFGTINVPASFLDDLRDSGVNVLEYRPIAPWRKGWGILRRNHRKLLVVDGTIGFLGGINIGDEWLSVDRKGQGWHDIHARISGPGVRDLSKLSMATWRVHGDVILDPRLFLREGEPTGNTRIGIVGSRERKKRKVIRRSYLHAIRNAREYIYIANAYFIPELGFRRALRNAVKRGVDVRVMVPAHGDILPVQLASQALFGRLLRRGIKLFLWREAVLHAKIAVIDDIWATVGSFNIDRRSWSMNLEANVTIIDRAFAMKLKAVFEKDQQKCDELDRVKWRRRPWYQRLVERFFYQFRKLM
jgi:cardiolipin synthase